MKKNVNLWIVLCSIFLFSIKWYYPFSNFDESIDVRIIFESVSDGYYFYPLLKALSNFNLSYSFDPSVENLRTIVIPTGAFFLHFIFYLLMGSWSIVDELFHFKTGMDKKALPLMAHYEQEEAEELISSFQNG